MRCCALPWAACPSPRKAHRLLPPPVTTLPDSFLVPAGDSWALANLLTHASFSAPDLPITLYLGGGDYHFTYPGDAAHPRLPPILGSVVIHGNGAALHLHGSNTESPADRLVIGQTGSLHLHHLHLKAGRGRAILNHGTLHLTDSSLANELGAPDYYLPDGGGIENRGTLTLTRSRFARNRLLTETTPGGALANFGTLAATCAIFEDNRAAQGGALWNAVGGTLHVSHSRFSGNQANGGALYNTDTSGALIVEGYFGGGLPVIDDLYFGTDTLSARVTYSVSSVDYTLEAGCAAAAPVPPPANVTVVPASSSAPPPEVVPIEGVAEGNVAFVRNGQIFINRLDGGAERQITFPSSDNAWHRLPKWSPDGTKLAIIRFISNNHQILIADLSTEPPVLTAVGQPYYYVSSLEWSPDGSQLLFVLPYNEDHGAYMINLDGSSRTRLPISDPNGTQRVRSAAWSPDGELLAFTHGGQNLQLFVMGDSQPLMWCQMPSPVFWSPNSQEVGCISNEPPLFSQSYLRVATVNPPSTARILANGIGWARWSQHGQFIASDYNGMYTYLFDETGDFETTKRLMAQNISQADLSPDACVGYRYPFPSGVRCRLVETCTNLQLVATNPAQIVLDDMLVSTDQGLQVLGAPSINAKKQGLLAWNTPNLQVLERIAFPPDAPLQVWYHITAPIDGWIVAQFGDADFIVGGDLCSNRPAPTLLTFEYDRVAAAAYAIAQSYANDTRDKSLLLEPGGRVSLPIVSEFMILLLLDGNTVLVMEIEFLIIG
ncbi:MAG: hypothetical protein DYG88_18040 [Chloroflexi bacterium CFX4]|nr:hypothetical protein [Chloroflexi bacterium CFX4]